DATACAGAAVGRTKTAAFVLSSLSATIAGILLVGYAGVHPSVGQGFELTASTAVVLGGAARRGGRGPVPGALRGPLTPDALLTRLNATSVPATMRDAVQGAIIIAAVAYSGVVFARRRRRQAEPAVESDASPTTSAGVSPSIPLTDGNEAGRE